MKHRLGVGRKIGLVGLGQLLKWLYVCYYL